MYPLTSFEKKLLDKGIKVIAGIDEAGRGPLAGPMVVASVVLKPDVLIKLSINNPNLIEHKEYLEIKDSKKLSEKKRNRLDDFIKANALDYKIEEISHKIIDLKGISHGTQVGFFNCYKNLSKKVEHVLTDNFMIKAVPTYKQTNIVKGDGLSISIAAASILAKVHRDNIMREFAKKYTKYGFEKHKGYGTKSHIDILKKLGPCDIHRKSFDPVKSMLL